MHSSFMHMPCQSFENAHCARFAGLCLFVKRSLSYIASLAQNSARICSTNLVPVSEGGVTHVWGWERSIGVLGPAN